MRRLGLAVVLALLMGLALVGTMASPAAARTDCCLFGTVSRVQDEGMGLTVITVADVDGPSIAIETLDEQTIVTIPGRERSLARNLVAGDFIAATLLTVTNAINLNTASMEDLQVLERVGPVLAQAIVDYREANGPFASVDEIVEVPGIGAVVLDLNRRLMTVGDRPVAGRILARPKEASLTSHLTGMVVDTSSTTLTLMDRSGNRLELALAEGTPEVLTGTLVTVVTRLDIASGDRVVTGVDEASLALGRLAVALEESELVGRVNNLENLKKRLVNTTAGQLSTLHDVAEHAPGVVPLERAMNQARDLLSAFEVSGGPQITVTGNLVLIDTSAGVIGVSTRAGGPLELAVDVGTLIRSGGRPIFLSEGLIGSRMRVTYDISTLKARLVEVLTAEELAPEAVRALLPAATRGDVEGEVTGVAPDATPPTLTVRPATGGQVTLRITAELREVLKGIVLPLPDLVGQRLYAMYDPDTMEVQSLEPVRAVPGEVPISGVITGLILKEPRQVTIAPSLDRTTTLRLQEETIVRKDGLRVPVNAIRLGDLVLPSSRYSSGDSALRVLELRTPLVLISGSIRGLDLASRRVTVSDPARGLVTLVLTGTTEIHRLGVPASLDTVVVGERLGAGSLYNGATLEAQRLAIAPPEIATARGTIVNLDLDRLVVTLVGPGEEVLELLVPNKPGVLSRSGSPVSFGNLRAGDIVQLVTYHWDNKIVVRMNVS